MIRAFAHTTKAATDLSDRLYNTKGQEFDAMVKSMETAQPSPLGGAYVYIPPAGSASKRSALKGETMVMSSGEVRKVRGSNTQPVGMAAITALVFGKTDLADMMMMHRLLGGRPEQTWQRSQLSKMAHRVLSDDPASASEVSSSKAGNAGGALGP